MMKINITFREIIKPSTPTPHHLRNFKLSFLDQLISPVYVPIILFYSNNETSNAKQPLNDISIHLRKSLSDVLTQFFPLAGRMKDESWVDCNDEGVDYSEAEVDGQLSNTIERPEIEFLNQLIPCKNNSEKFNMKEQLAIQVNFFGCGGVAIGICISHRIADGLSLITFIKAWAATSLGSCNLVCPSFDSASLFPPRVLPGSRRAAQSPDERLVTRRFLFAASSIATLKSEVSNCSSSFFQPTRVEAVSALLWKSAVADAELNPSGESLAAHSVNLRGRITPPLPEYSFGNLFQMSIASATYGQTDLAALAGKLREAIKKIDGEYIREIQGEDGYGLVSHELGELISKGKVQFLRFSSWCRFSVYEADFGFGKPVWVSSAGMAFKNMIVLFDSRDGEGIEAWVTMDEEHMTKFEQNPDLQNYVN